MPTRMINSDFNDLNLEEPSRYIKHAGKCHFLGNIQFLSKSMFSIDDHLLFVTVDLDNEAVTDLQPSYATHSNWTIEAQHEYLNAAESNPFFRAFYIPFVSRKFTKYNKYLLLRRVSPRRLVPSED